ncbi:MAG: hypothetical protein ACRCUJ_11435 [Phocaeicola sp.]
MALLLVAAGFHTYANTTVSSFEAASTTMYANQHPIYQIDDVLENAASLVGKEIELEGVCTHICRHGGRKIFLMGSDDKQTIRIELGRLERFEQKNVKSLVEVTGTVVESRIDEAYLQAWEERERAQKAEKHGESEAGCSTEMKARGESGNSVEDRIAQFRQRIKAEEEKTGNPYLSFYHIKATSYQIK